MLFGSIGLSRHFDAHEQQLARERDAAAERRAVAAVLAGRTELVDRIVDGEAQLRARQLDDDGRTALEDDWRSLDRRVVSSSQLTRSMLSGTPDGAAPELVRAVSKLVVATGLDADQVCCVGTRLPLAGLRRDLADEALQVVGLSADAFAGSGLGVAAAPAPPPPAAAPTRQRPPLRTASAWWRFWNR